jgi:hypothetical protein
MLFRFDLLNPVQLIPTTCIYNTKALLLVPFDISQLRSSSLCSGVRTTVCVTCAARAPAAASEKKLSTAASCMEAAQRHRLASSARPTLSRAPASACVTRQHGGVQPKEAQPRPQLDIHITF